MGDIDIQSVYIIMGDQKIDNRTVNCCGRELTKKKVVRWSVAAAFGLPLFVLVILLVTCLIRE